jgi:hypothetical protein
MGHWGVWWWWWWESLSSPDRGKAHYKYVYRSIVGGAHIEETLSCGSASSGGTHFAAIVGAQRLSLSLGVDRHRIEPPHRPPGAALIVHCFLARCAPMSFLMPTVDHVHTYVSG